MLRLGARPGARNICRKTISMLHFSSLISTPRLMPPAVTAGTSWGDDELGHGTAAAGGPPRRGAGAGGEASRDAGENEGNGEEGVGGGMGAERPSKYISRRRTLWEMAEATGGGMHPGDRGGSPSSRP